MTTHDQLRENIIGRLTEVRGLLETHGAAAALPRLERHIQDLQEMQHVSANQPLYDALSALADMWNQYCPPGVGHAYTSTGEYAEGVLKAAGLMGADGVASFPAELPAPRSLSSLTEDEARECYRLAFGRDSNRSIRVDRDHATILDITGYSYMLSVHQDGRMYVASELSGEGTEFNAARLVRYLDSLGIALGE